MKKTVKELTKEQYEEVYNSTFENTQKLMNEKGVYDTMVIKRMTDIAVGIALKKAHATYKRKE